MPLVRHGLFGAVPNTRSITGKGIARHQGWSCVPALVLLDDSRRHAALCRVGHADFCNRLLESAEQFLPVHGLWIWRRAPYSADSRSSQLEWHLCPQRSTFALCADGTIRRMGQWHVQRSLRGAVDPGTNASAARAIAWPAHAATSPAVSAVAFRDTLSPRA